MVEMPNALTPDNIAAVAQNAEQIISLLRCQNEPEVASACGTSLACCCPRKVKFFVFGNTCINNYNSQCPGLSLG